MASEIITDRDLATQTTTYGLWKPRNAGPNDSWGVLLNENADALDLLFADVYSQILVASQTNSVLEAAVGTLNSRVDGVEADITNVSSSLGSTITSLSALQNEIASARGVFSTIGSRIGVVVDTSGAVQLDTIFQNVRTVKWIGVNAAVSGVTSVITLAGVFPGELASPDGVAFGVRVDDAEVRILASDFSPIYDANGVAVAGKASQSGNDLLITLIKTTDGTGATINAVSEYQHSQVRVLYQKIVRESDDDIASNFVGAVKVPNLATTLRHGVVRLGHGKGLDADTIDTYHASSTPAANTLLPLDTSGQYPASLVRVDNNGTLITLQLLQKKFLRTEGADEYKSIADYIGAAGLRIFPLVKAGDEGAQFTKPIASGEYMLDDHEARLDAIEPVVAQQTVDIASVSGEVDVLQSQMSAHLPDPDAHHSSTSAGLNITPASVVTGVITAESGTFQNLTVSQLNVEVASYFQEEVYIKDRFTDIRKASGDGPFGSEEVPLNDDYYAGFVFHKGATYVSGEYAVLRYNKTRNQIEFAPVWKPWLAGYTSGEYNAFYNFQGAATAIVGQNGEGYYSTISSALVALGVGGGKILVHRGVYAESLILPGNVILEGVGPATFVSGDITLSGEFNTLRDIKVLNTFVDASSNFGKIKDSYLVNDTVDSGSYTVLADNIITG